MFWSECVPIHNDSSTGVLRYCDGTHLFRCYLMYIYSSYY
nr:MAG TPA: hypothetical protein [Caudoviricetes sp.]